jgi:hypothetical protein
MKKNEIENNLLRIMKSKKSWTDPGGSIDLYTIAYQSKKNYLSNTIDYNKVNYQYFSKNFIKDFSFENNKNNKWSKYYNGFIYTEKVKRSGKSSIMIKNDNKDSLNGASQTIFLHQQYPKKIYFFAWSKAIDVIEVEGGLYSIYLDITFNDKTQEFGYSIPFSKKTHIWEFKDSILNFEKPIYKINFFLLFNKYIGTCYFDDVYLGNF